MAYSDANWAFLTDDFSLENLVFVPFEMCEELFHGDGKVNKIQNSHWLRLNIFCLILGGTVGLVKGIPTFAGIKHGNILLFSRQVIVFDKDLFHEGGKGTEGLSTLKKQ